MINAPSDKPIGYWLKKLDSLIDGQFERQLSDTGLSRRQWQLLNLLEGSPRPVPEIRKELEPFVEDSQDDLGDALSALVSRGWADSQDNIITLTETGQRQIGLVQAKVAQIRQALMAGISPDEYQATIEVLSRMAANLEFD